MKLHVARGFKRHSLSTLEAMTHTTAVIRDPWTCKWVHLLYLLAQVSC